MEMDDPNRQQQTYTSSNSNNSKREREKERMSVVVVVLDVGPSQTTTTAMTSEASGDERYVRLSVNFFRVVVLPSVGLSLGWLFLLSLPLLSTLLYHILFS